MHPTSPCISVNTLFISDPAAILATASTMTTLTSFSENRFVRLSDPSSGMTWLKALSNFAVTVGNSLGFVGVEKTYSPLGRKEKEGSISHAAGHDVSNIFIALERFYDSVLLSFSLMNDCRKLKCTGGLPRSPHCNRLEILGCIVSLTLFLKKVFWQQGWLNVYRKDWIYYTHLTTFTV